MMKKLLFGSLLSVLISSCVAGQKQNDNSASNVSITDSLLAGNDSLGLHSLDESVALPTNADESFIDFLYNFSQNKGLQRSRIAFPLPYTTPDESISFTEKGWKHESLFADVEAYTVLFDNEKEMDIEKDELTNEVKVEWFYLDKKEIKSYSFKREDGIWILASIDLAAFPTEELSDESFLTFYHRFVIDAEFQKYSLANPLKFVTKNPDDEFEIIDTVMDYEQWLSYQSVVPTFLTNVNYGQSLDSKSHTKIIELKGFGNGFNNTLYFKKRGKEWKLVQYEDLGD